MSKIYPLIILHGWGHSTQNWQTIANSFTDRKVILFDLPGFGKEPLVSADWGIPEYANWVEDKLASMNITEAVLLGHSLGGRIGSLIASQNPMWLKRLILYAAPSIYRPSTTIKLKIRFAKLLKRFGLKARIRNPELNEADSTGLGRIFRNVVNFDQTTQLPNIAVPTLLIWGENDTVVPTRIANEINSLIPDSKLVTLDNLGHNAHLENPNVFYGTVKLFLESL